MAIISNSLTTLFLFRYCFLFCGKLNYYVYKCIRWHKCDCNCAKAFTRKILADTFLGGFHKTLYFFLRPFFIAIELCFLFYLSID